MADAERGVGEIGETGGRVDELLGFTVLGHLQIGGDHETGISARLADTPTTGYVNSSSSVFASLKSDVSKPSYAILIQSISQRQPDDRKMFIQNV